MAYFDNAATTYPKPEVVYSFMNDFYRNFGGSAGRGDYQLSNTAKGIIDETRSLLMSLFHCPSKKVIFEPSATISLNIIIQGLIENGVKNIYISPFEHNAVTRTLHHYEMQNRIKVFELNLNSDLSYDLTKIQYQFDQITPDLVIISHASNVIGLVAPVEDIFSLAKRYKAVTLVDMAQTAGLIDINLGLETIDFAVFAGHKTLLGPTGISGFIMNPAVHLAPVIFGGTGYDSANQDMPNSIPEKYEMGTLNIAGIAGLNAALRWIKQKGIDNLYLEEQHNRDKLIEVLSNYSFIRIIGNYPNNKYVGIVSCLFDGISSDSMGPILSERNVAVRTGLHCAPRAHSYLNTYPAGTVRFSVNTFTNDHDFQVLNDALDSIREEM